MWRLLKYFFISLLVLVILVCASIGIVLNFIFTPEKLTPIVEKSANEFLNAEVHFDAIELTFFSTFPEFGLEMRNGSVVTKVFQDSLKQENVYAATDSLSADCESDGLSVSEGSYRERIAFGRTANIRLY